MSADDTHKEGFLDKNHAGKEFKANSNVHRWFVSNGFQVVYYSDKGKATPKGHFDLRNVLSLAPSAAAGAGTGAIDLAIGEERKKSQKIMTIAFKGDAVAERDAWLTLWCSAVLVVHVHESLKKYHVPALANKLNAEFAAQAGIARKRGTVAGIAFLHGGDPKHTGHVLTPREDLAPEPVPEEAPVQSSVNGAAPAADKTIVAVPKIAPQDLDTPRETPPGTPAEPAPSRSALPSPAVLPPPGTGAPDQETFEITVPEGVAPGSRLQATTPSGVKVKLVVPPGAQAGMLLTFQVPAGAKRSKKAAREEELVNNQAAKIQAIMRGHQVRAGSAIKAVPPMPPPGRGAPDGVPPTREAIEGAAIQVAIERAAIKLQSSFRGHAQRNTQQEKARLQWLEYYIQPEVGEYDQAEALALTPEEIAMVAKAKAEGGGGMDAEELRRISWLKHYLSAKDFSKANELVTTAVEGAMVLKATAMASRVLCSCIPRAGEVERERQQKFATAVRTYEWEIAEILAMHADEFQDVADSKRRVGCLLHAQKMGDFASAQQYVITAEEAAAVAEAAAAVRSAVATNASEADEAAVAKLQASIRGRAARQTVQNGKTEAAAVRVQAIARGHMQRDAQQEARRQEWLQYYVGEKMYDKALELAVDQREIDAIMQLKSQAASRDELSETCWCFGAKGEPAAAVSTAERPLGEAIKEYNWSLAEALAADDDERQDVRDSRARVEWMREYTLRHEYEAALQMAITHAEVAEIRAAHGRHTK